MLMPPSPPGVPLHACIRENAGDGERWRMEYWRR